MKEKMCSLTIGIKMLGNNRMELKMSYSIQSVELDIMKNKNVTKICGQMVLGLKKQMRYSKMKSFTYIRRGILSLV